MTTTSGGAARDALRAAASALRLAGEYASNRNKCEVEETMTYQ
jgi:hypothetical protein